MSKPATIGQKLKKARIEKGLSLLKLAQKIGVSSTYIWKLEHDKYRKKINVFSLLDLCDVLDVSLSYLLDAPGLDQQATDEETAFLRKYQQLSRHNQRIMRGILNVLWEL